MCNVCQGVGKMIDKKLVEVDFQGLVCKEEVIEIDILVGVEDGMQLFVFGKGNVGLFNGIFGDLIVVIEEYEYDELKCDGDDLYYEVYIFFIDVVFGEFVEVLVIGGKVKIKVDFGM